MIGVGVYTTSGYTLAALGSPTRVLWAWAIGGVIAMCGSIGYASLATRFSESGGEYLFLARTLHPVAGMMAGWVSLLAGFTGAIALAAIALEEYSRPMFQDGLAWLPAKSVALGVVSIAALFHIIGVRRGARLQDVFVVVKMALIVGFIVYGFSSIRSADHRNLVDVHGGAVQPMSALVFTNQLVWISLSFAGFNAAVYIAGEIDDPKRNVPRAMIAGTILVTIIYLALNAVFLLGSPQNRISGESQVAALAAEAIGGPGFAKFVTAVIVLSLFTSVSALVMTGPRVYAKMADDGLLPVWFRFRDRPPAAAIGFQAALAMIVVLATSLKELIGYLGLTLSICSALTVTMVFVLSRRGEAICVPLWGVPAAIYVTATLILAFMSAVHDPMQAFAAGVTLGIGIIAYPIVRRRHA